MLIAVIADDLTGAADTGVQLVRAGYRTAVAFRGSPLPPDGDMDAVAVETDSRSMPAGFAARRVVEAAHAVRGADVVYKKIDSTLRGPVAAELSAALGATGREKAIVAPAFPAAGRTTKDGVQTVRGVPVHETEARNDPRTPVREGHLPTLLEEVGPVASLGVDALGDRGAVRRALAGARCVVADVEDEADLEALVRAVPDPSAVLWTGSAGLALAFGRVYPGPRADGPSRAHRPARCVLVVVGSLSGASRGQLRRLAEEHGAVPVPVGRPGAMEEAVCAAREMLREGRHAAVYSPEDRGGADAGAVVEALAGVVKRLSEEGLFDALVLTGGDTAVGVARRLGASGIRLLGEVGAGIPVGTLVGPRPYTVVTKAGGFGEDGTLVNVLQALSRCGED
ncbi:MAG: four-carbon acid sugar kinase family protein [Actinomycetota bacterium]|nr:four-carbon acid sugar kinase family protein [Actinomycetota bacterium]